MKIIRYLIATIIAAGIIAFGFIYFIGSGIDKKTTYTEKDLLQFYSLTDKEIKHAPKISHSYYFVYQPGDGYAPSNSVIFNHTTDAAPLRAYLQGNGYTLQPGKFGDSEVWKQKSQPQSATFYLWINQPAQQVTLSKEVN